MPQVDFDLIRGLVKRGLDTFGEFALFWNQDLDAVVRRRQDRGQALRRHADMVCEALKGCLPRRELTSEMLLPEGSEKEIDAGFVGVAWRIRGLSRFRSRSPNGQSAGHLAIGSMDCRNRKEDRQKLPAHQHDFRGLDSRLYVSRKSLGTAAQKRSRLKVFIRSHEFPEPVLVQPNGIRISGNEFLDGQAVNRRRTRHPLLLAVDEDGHEFLLSLARARFSAAVRLRFM